MSSTSIAQRDSAEKLFYTVVRFFSQENWRVRSHRRGVKIQGGTFYEEQVFDGLEFKQQSVRSSTFEFCKFIGCDFSEAEFIDCKFFDCVFKDSNLSTLRLDGTRFRNTEFSACKVTGVNWTSLDWNSVALSAPFFFDACDISYCVFSGLKLSELQLTRCKAHDVDFSECDLREADFFEADLLNARFNLSKLDQCNFKDAINYMIDPLNNSIEGASFSVPEVLSLLRPFKITIDDD
jgi:uncharacterized protein YjbI with pentapeptide repeats